MKYFCNFVKENIKAKDDILKLDSLLEIFSKKRNISIEKIENLLNSILIETKDYISKGCLNQDEEKMIVEITDRNDKIVRYKIEGIADVSGEIWWCRSCLGCFNRKMARR